MESVVAAGGWYHSPQTVRRCLLLIPSEPKQPRRLGVDYEFSTPIAGECGEVTQCGEGPSLALLVRGRGASGVGALARGGGVLGELGVDWEWVLGEAALGEAFLHGLRLDLGVGLGGGGDVDLQFVVVDVDEWEACVDALLFVEELLDVCELLFA